MNIKITIIIIVLAGGYYFISKAPDNNIQDNKSVVVIGEKPKPKTAQPTKCLPTQRGTDTCIALYQPVCGLVNVQCITTPCNPQKKTFSNSCVACSNSLVSEYIEGECSIK